MPPLDSATILAPVSDDQPAGQNLEFDPDFGALERAAQGKPEQQYGNTIIPAEEPDWKDVAAQANALLERTRDLRVLAHLAVARLHLNGLVAYAEIVGLTRTLLETRWEAIHPQLDPEDDNDPTLRANALLRLGHPGLTLRFLRTVPLVTSPRAGAISWRDIAIATGQIESDNAGPALSEQSIRSAFQDSDPARIATVRQAVQSIVGDIAAIQAAFDSNAGYGTSPDLSDLAKLMGDIGRMMDRYAAPGAADEMVEVEAGSAAAESAGDAADESGAAAAETTPRPRGGGAVSAAALGEITTRADALRLLDLVCRYYQRCEPSSPLPLLIERARKLADKSFLDVLRELAPDGLMQAQSVVSSRDEQY